MCWGHYQDDCSGIWNGSSEELRVFTSYLSSISPSIKFTVQYNCYQLEVLDVLVRKENGLLETMAYSKKTNGHMYLLPSSCHFHTVSENIPYGVALWLKRICSTETDFNMKLDEYQTHLIARGHSKKRVRKQFHKASLISREAALTKTLKNHSNNKTVFNLGAIIHKHFPILHNRNNDLILFFWGHNEYKTLELSKHWSADSTLARNEVIMKTTYPVKSIKCDKICSNY